MNAPLLLLATARELPSGDAFLHAGERAILSRLRAPRRRRDFRLGRFVAKRALALAAGSDPAQAGVCFEIQPAPSGAPVPFADGVPLAFSLSITHCDGWAAAAVQEPGGRLGCDLERIAPRSPVFEQDYFTEAERAQLAEGHDAADRALRATLAWSAKEAVMKALGEGLRLAPRAVEVRLSFPAAPPEQWRPFRILRPAQAAGLVGSWRVVDGFALTVAAGVGNSRLVRLRATES